MDDFEIELKMTFLDEAMSLLEESEEYYMNLEDTAGDIRILDAIFRNAHSLKGSSKAAGFDQIGVLTHSLENVLLKIKEGQMKVTANLVSLLLKVNDVLRHQIEALMSDLNYRFDPSGYITELDSAGTEGFEESHVMDSTPVESANDIEELPFGEEQSVAQIEETGFQIFDDVEVIPREEMKQEIAPTVKETETKLAIVPQEIASQKADAKVKVMQHDEKIRVSLDKIETLINSVGELVILHAVLSEEARKSGSLELQKVVDQIGKIVKEVQEVSMGLRMIPIKQVFQKMQRITRDCALDLGKKVNFNLVGEEVEVDKTVLDQIGDPLVHITRNAIDHGIEAPDVRTTAGKNPCGEVTLSAYHESGRLIISMIDDGKGIDPKFIRKKAIEKGVISPNSHMNDLDLINLVFHPGFSTKEQVTALSGRGVGMDVVKTNIENLSGEIVLNSVVGKGSEIKISLPLTLAIIDGLIVKIYDRKYVIPLNFVLESVSVTAGNIKFVTGIGDVLLLRGENLPLISLSNVLGLQQNQEIENPIAIVAQVGNKSYAILVDDIISRSQVVVKRLGAEVQNIKGFSGGTILGDGRPSLIIEIPDIVNLHKPNLKPVLLKKGKAA